MNTTLQRSLKDQVAALSTELALLLQLGDKIVGELNVDKLFPAIVDIAREVIDADTMLLSLLDNDYLDYHYAAASGLNAERIQGQRFESSVGMCSWVLSNKKPLLFGHGQAMPMGDNTEWEAGMESILLVPLIARGAIIGGLSGLGKRGGGSFTEFDLNLLTVFANQASIAIDNALMLDRMNRQASDTESLIRELTWQKQHAEVALESMTDGVMTTDRDGLVMRVNTVACLMLGMPRVDIMGRPIDELFFLFNDSGEEVENTVSRAFGYDCMVRESETITLSTLGGKNFPVEMSAAILRDEHFVADGSVLVFRDVEERRRLTQTLQHQATHDHLTGLINRQEFEYQIERILDRGGEQHAMIYIDLYQFKAINDTCGHAAGDAMLCRVAELLRTPLREADLLARIGGDEFGLLLKCCPIDKAEYIAKMIRDLIAGFHLEWDGQRYSCGASIGVVPITSDSLGLEQVMSAADIACYSAKERGRNRIHVAQVNDITLAEKQDIMRWLPRIQFAIDNDNFKLNFQRIVPCDPDSKHRPHVELLLRMVEKDLSIVPPGAFIPPAERYDLMPEIDRWVLKKAFAMLPGQIESGRFSQDTLFSINLSGTSIRDLGLIDFIDALQADSDLAPEDICFEITERSAIENLSTATELISVLRGKGYNFSLDDFGSGLSSFSYLKALPVDFLKIDGMFIQAIAKDPIDRAMVKSINEIGHVMGITTVAEFVEDQAILEILREIGVDYAQGYHVHKPEPI